ncbi:MULTISPECIES: phage tail assembly protein [unclassified Pseudomonas]|uniref:phage tail assembly protein n=1 Tax=unclassified Pseudomonas TaxID=196821 RepID=UPI00244A89BB|nr:MULTISPECIES: phage tail assembly protein [unclassified Pseudomonas]MDH0894355.1 phage tail assembly protein [Pseudomonas sp. GD03875]MDH1063350.1 phage tail assembly protein [Pseudomonas sp. GD03985]
MADALRITLKFPVQSPAGNTITHLPIQRLKRKDLMFAQQNFEGDAAIENYLVSRMVGLTIEDLAELDLADSNQVNEVFREVVGGGDGSKVLGRGAATGVALAAKRDSKPGNE